KRSPLSWRLISFVYVLCQVSWCLIQQQAPRCSWILLLGRTVKQQVVSLAQRIGQEVLRVLLSILKLLRRDDEFDKKRPRYGTRHYAAPALRRAARSWNSTSN